jgi:sugar-specific transcriptional regulator TrmB
MAQPNADELAQLGLTTYESKAYLALIRRGISTGSEVARLATLPRQRVYDVLASLAEKGLATAHPGSPARYSANPPELALQRLMLEHRQELSRLEREAKRMIASLAPAYEAGQSHSNPLDYIEVLRDRATIATRFDELQASVEREILVFTKPPYATPPEENVEGLKLVHDHTARGVYELSLLESPAEVDAVRRFIAAGSEARFVPELPLKLVILDETTVMFGMQDPVAGDTDLTIVVVEHPSLAHLLKIAFNAVWDQGLTLEEAERLAVAANAHQAASR